MAIIMFLFGSILGLTGALIQFAFGSDVMTCLYTYAFFSMGVPLVTLLALRKHSES